MCQQIARLTRCKLPLDSTLAAVASGQSPLANSANLVRGALASGQSLSHALQGKDARQSRVLAACIESGQAANSLDVALLEWTSMHIADRRSAKRLWAVWIYPACLIGIMMISLGVSGWLLIPEIDATYAMFVDSPPQWLAWLVQLRRNYILALMLMMIAVIIPLGIWIWLRARRDENGISQWPEKRLRLQALAAKLAYLHLAAARPLNETVSRCVRVMGVEATMAETKFARLSHQEPIEPLSKETSLLLGALHAGIVERTQAVQLMRKIGDQLTMQAELCALREARLIPILVAIVVFVVTLGSYLTLVYMPWVLLMQQIGDFYR